VNVVVQDISAKPMELKAYTELAIRQMEAVFGENFLILESVPTSVSGQSAHRLVFIGKAVDPEPDLKYMSVWLLDGATAYQITYTAIASQYDRYVAKMKRMVSSFRIE
jgi:hypothetical protein